MRNLLRWHRLKDANVSAEYLQYTVTALLSKRKLEICVSTGCFYLLHIQSSLSAFSAEEYIR